MYLVRSSPDDLGLLNKSLGLVEENLLPAIKEPTDIILFHEPSFDSQYRGKVRSVKNGTIIFQEIVFTLPDYPAEIRNKIPEFYPHPTFHDHHGFPVGYRHMCDFFSGSIYDHPVLQQYEYYLRLDTDSFILSRVRYDMFKWMKRHKCEYAFIAPAVHQDHPKVIEDLWSETAQWIKQNNIQTYADIDTIPEGTTYYTNFELGKVSSFSAGSAYYRFYTFIRDSGNIFIRRWGDAPIKYLGVNLFIRPRAIRPVRGFIYQHGGTYDVSTVPQYIIRKISSLLRKR